MSGYDAKVMRTGPIFYQPQNETGGTVSHCLVNAAQNGTYNGVTLANDNTGPFGTVAPWFDGATSFNNIYSAALAAAFSGLEGTVMIWGKVANVGAWTDGAIRSLIRLMADANNYIEIQKRLVNRQRRWLYVANADADFVDQAAVTTIDWACYAMTWSDSGNQAIAYIDGAQEGAAMTPIGTFVGPIIANRVNIGASNTVGPAQPFHGWLGPCGIWTRAMSVDELASLAVA